MRQTAWTENTNRYDVVNALDRQTESERQLAPSQLQMLNGTQSKQEMGASTPVYLFMSHMLSYEA